MIIGNAYVGDGDISKLPFLVNGVASGVGSGVGAAVSRYFAKLDPLLNSYFNVTKPLVFSGDFDVEFYVATSKKSGVQVFIGGGNFPERFYIGTDDGKLLVGNGSERFVGSTTIADSIYNKIKWSVKDSIMTVKVNGVTLYSSAFTATFPKTIVSLGNYENTAFFMEGVMSDVIVTDKSSIDNIVTTFPISKPVNGIQFSKENSFGAELMSGSSLSAAGSCTVINNVMTMTVGSWGYMYEEIITEAGKTYYFEANVERLPFGNWTLRVWDSLAGYTQLKSKSSTGTHNGLLFTATSTKTRVAIHQGNPNVVGDTYTLSSVTLKEVHSNAIEYMNVVDVDKYTTIDSKWYGGQQQISNGGFNLSLDGWSYTAGVDGWSWESSKAKLNGSGGPQALNQSNAFDINNKYLIEYDVETDQGVIGIQNKAFGLIASGSTGRVSTEWIADTSTLSFKRATGVVNGTLDNISVKHIIEIAEQV